MKKKQSKNLQNYWVIDFDSGDQFWIEKVSSPEEAVREYIADRFHNKESGQVLVQVVPTTKMYDFNVKFETTPTTTVIITKDN